MPVAEFNIGILKYDWDDPRVADFQNNLDRVYAIAERSPGYIWHMPPEDMDLAQNDPGGVLGGNPRTASTLSVWEDVDALHRYTFETVHRQFYDRKGEWYDPAEQPPKRFVMWWVAPGHHPGIGEAAERMAHLAAHGASDHAFDWAWAKT